MDGGDDGASRYEAGRAAHDISGVQVGMDNVDALAPNVADQLTEDGKVVSVVLVKLSDGKAEVAQGGHDIGLVPGAESADVELKARAVYACREAVEQVLGPGIAQLVDQL